MSGMMSVFWHVLWLSEVIGFSSFIYTPENLMYVSLLRGKQVVGVLLDLQQLGTVVVVI